MHCVWDTRILCETHAHTLRVFILMHKWPGCRSRCVCKGVSRFYHESLIIIRVTKRGSCDLETKAWLICGSNSVTRKFSGASTDKSKFQKSFFFLQTAKRATMEYNKAHSRLTFSYTTVISCLLCNVMRFSKDTSHS